MCRASALEVVSKHNLVTIVAFVTRHVCHVCYVLFLAKTQKIYGFISGTYNLTTIAIFLCESGHIRR